tara:strand:+ start:339 stop:866 length:528 start_codon:yes stop_codon:yes gene_type:complete
MIRFLKERLGTCEYEYPFAKKVNSILERQIKELYDPSQIPPNINAHFTGWHLDSKEVRNLVRWVSDLVCRDFISQTSTLMSSEVWGVMFKEGDYITEHAHTPSIYSFVYYVNTPKGSSPLIFSTSGYKVKPKEGKLIIFDSALLHKVPPNKCNNRCVISGNFIWDKPTGTFGVDY